MDGENYYNYKQNVPINQCSCSTTIEVDIIFGNKIYIYNIILLGKFYQFYFVSAQCHFMLYGDSKTLSLIYYYH